MKKIIEYVYSENADGIVKSVRGGGELQKARKLAKQGLARIKFLDGAFVGYGRTTDVGYIRTRYEVTYREMVC
jgi:hypothetical protein